eukprot:6251448-Prymnesium_polylepis.1
MKKNGLPCEPAAAARAGGVACGGCLWPRGSGDAARHGPARSAGEPRGARATRVGGGRRHGPSRAH